MLQFYFDFMDKYLDRSDFQYFEMDTDSAYFVIAGLFQLQATLSFTNLVKRTVVFTQSTLMVQVPLMCSVTIRMASVT